MSVLTLYIKYTRANVTVEDVTDVFNNLFEEDVVVKVTELVKQDKRNGRDFKMFFIECDQKKQKKGNVDRLACNITHNEKKGDGKGVKVTIDDYDHYWLVKFAEKQPGLKPTFKPRIMDEREYCPGDQYTLDQDARETLRGDSKGRFELELPEDDPELREAMEEAASRSWAR